MISVLLHDLLSELLLTNTHFYSDHIFAGGNFCLHFLYCSARFVVFLGLQLTSKRIKSTQFNKIFLGEGLWTSLSIEGYPILPKLLVRGATA